MTKPERKPLANLTKSEPRRSAPETVEEAASSVPVGEGRKTKVQPSRERTVHVGGHYPPVVRKQLRQIAVDEDKTIQQVLAEALNDLFVSRNMPQVAPTERG